MDQNSADLDQKSADLFLTNEALLVNKLCFGQCGQNIFSKYHHNFITLKITTSGHTGFGKYKGWVNLTMNIANRVQCCQKFVYQNLKGHKLQFLTNKLWDTLYQATREGEKEESHMVESVVDKKYVL